MNAQPRRRAAALLEVLGIYLAGQGVTGLLVSLLGLRPVNPLDSFTAGITDTGLITATRQLFVLLMLQYAGYFLLIIPINSWHRRPGPAAYGLTRAGHSWTVLLLAGLATAALAEWPVLSVNVVNSIHPLGETAPWRQALFDTSWRRWEFWLFSAVLSWAFVAVVEELFFRGYCQRRLAEDWGNGAAIAGTACLFTFAHSQYLLPNAYSAAMIASLLVLAIGFGMVFAWTRSLIPSVVAHAIINVPMTPPWQGVILAAFVIGAVVVWRRGAGVVKRVFSGATVFWCVALALVGMGYAIASRRVEGLVFAAAAMVALAVVLEALDRRQDPAAEPASTSA
jgi:membrane protease YdiL (CAAX protease family)